MVFGFACANDSHRFSLNQAAKLGPVSCKSND